MARVDYAVVNAPKTTERNFEDDVERFLNGCGWMSATANDYNRKLALKIDSLVGFIRDTQPEEWAKIESMYGEQGAVEQFYKRVNNVLEPHEDRDGLIYRLRRGFDMAPGASFRLCYFKPASGKNPDAQARYEANRFEIVRQLRYGTLPEDENNSIDTVLFLNGIPIVTMELKNNLSGQRTDNAVEIVLPRSSFLNRIGALLCILH